MIAPQRIQATLVSNVALAPKTFVLRFSGCAALAQTLPGQFVMVQGDGWPSDPLLPRAFSLLAVLPDGQVDLLIKNTGKASALFEQAKPGARFYVLGPLGSTFPTPTAERTDWLLAGGVGLAPMMMHAARARDLGVVSQQTLFFGGRSAQDLVLTAEVNALGAKLVLATEDGSKGHRGYVTGAVEAALSAHGDAPAPTLMACGPEPMLEAVAQLAHRHTLPAYLSLEGEMACGIGACLVCAVPCKSRKFRYTCVDGPVFDLDDLAGPYAPSAAREEGLA